MAGGQNAGHLRADLLRRGTGAADAVDAGELRQGLLEGCEALVLAQMTQEAEDEPRTDPPAHLGLGAGTLQAIHDGGKGDTACGMGLRVEEQFGMHHAVGMGALKEHGEGLGEVKRMYTLPEVRGQRVGAAILKRIEEEAHARGVTRLVLETGEAPGFEPAWRVYERGGFSTCGAVLDYPDSGFSRFYEKKLA